MSVSPAQSRALMRVLIVDDHKVLRRGLREVVEEEFPESEFEEADTSQKALSLVHERGWDLVLLDINLPGRNGLEVLQEIKQVAPKTPVLVVSAYAEEDFAVRALKLRAAGYLTKSCVADELGAAIRKARAGGRYVTASLAERLAQSVGTDIKGRRTKVSRTASFRCCGWWRRERISKRSRRSFA